MSKDNVAIPRPEYPQPMLCREQWLNLNGRWAFEFDQEDDGEAQGWFKSHTYQKTILVPYPWQSKLSGIASPYHGIAWYQRHFTLPETWADKHIILHFGAADYVARVWVDGTLAGEHLGGQTPFEFDITNLLADPRYDTEHTVTVRVEDPADLREIPHGKQMSDPRDPWWSCCFTPSSGIWQTVWLEPRSASYISRVQITPQLASSSADFEIVFYGPPDQPLSVHIQIDHPQHTEACTPTIVAEATVQDVRVKPQLSTATVERTISHTHVLTSQEIIAGRCRFSISIPNARLWCPADPYLYQTWLTLHEEGQTAPLDEIHTYFGMRNIAVEQDKLLLNGEPLYLMTALDQGFWPDGLYTAPTDDDLRKDVELALAAGLNGIRKHIKLEDPRYLYWADSLGLLVWEEMPSFTLFTALAKDRFELELVRMVERDYNHPCIVIWGLFNEEWGLETRLLQDRDKQDYVVMLYDRVKRLDAMRPVVDNSGWWHVKSDIADFHWYTADLKAWDSALPAIRQDGWPRYFGRGVPFRLYVPGFESEGQPVMNGEYSVGQGDKERGWHLRWQTNILRKHDNIIGYVYTELYDIEHELCGYYDYQRALRNLGVEPHWVNTLDFVSVDLLPADQDRDLVLCPGQLCQIPLWLSHYGSPLGEGASLHFELEGTQISGQWLVEPRRWAVARAGEIAFTAPTETGTKRLVIRLRDAAGQVRAQNHLIVAIVAQE